MCKNHPAYNSLEIIKIISDHDSFNEQIDYQFYNHKIEELYLSLTKQEIEALKVHVNNLIEAGKLECASEILLGLVCILDEDINKCLISLLYKKQFNLGYTNYSGIFYRKATSEIRDLLIQELETNVDDRYHLLCALSWIGDQKVVELFSKWRKDPPSWANSLGKTLDQFSFISGWELSAEGARRDLFFHDCYPLVKGDLLETQPLSVLDKHEEKCQWCGLEMTTFMECHLDSSIFSFLGLEGDKLNIATCPLCVCYGTIYTDFDVFGHSTWNKSTQTPRFLPKNNPEGEASPLHDSLKLINKPRNFFYSTNMFDGISASQVGGHPRWEQNPEYPICPTCNGRMKFLCQLEGSDLKEGWTGMYYSFICCDCKICATSYQQG